MGNEHRAAFIHSDLPKQLYAMAKELDPLRFVIASDGGVPYPSADFHGNPSWMRPYRKNETEDFYSKGLPITPLLQNAPEPDRPLVGHEEGNFNTFPHLLKAIGDLTPPGKASKFLKPFWLTGARDHLEATGLLGETELWAQRSGQLLVLNFKQLIEYFRSSPWVSGHEWWLFAQFWLAGNGLVDYAYDVKPGMTSSAVSSYLGDVVLLAGNGSGIAPAYVAGSELSVPLSISNFGAAAVGARVAVDRADAGRVPPPLAGIALCVGGAARHAAAVPPRAAAVVARRRGAGCVAPPAHSAALALAGRFERRPPAGAAQ